MTDAEKINIYIAAGGTGGHISPGIALGESFLATGKYRVFFFTLSRNITYPDIQRFAKKKEVMIIGYDAPQLPRSLGGIFHFIQSFRQALSMIRRVAKQQPPLAVLGMGGFPSFPLVFWSFIRRIPFFLCEQNAIWGRITSLMIRPAKRVFLSFPLKLKQGAKLPSKYCISGNPLRQDFWDDPSQKNIKKNKSDVIQKILMFGGSQGAKDINQLYQYIKEFDIFRKVSFTLICGPESFSEFKRHGRKQDTIIDFCTQMPAELKKHDLVICRSGSGTVFEIAWAQKAAIFLPYPFAVKDHQRHNAEFLVEQGCAAVIDKRPFDLHYAASQLRQMFTSGEILKIRKNAAEKQPLMLDAHITIEKVIADFLQKKYKR